MPEPTKRCCTCGLFWPLTEYNKRQAAKDGLQARCRSCSRNWYQRNKATHKVNVKVRRQRYRRWMFEQLALYLAEHPCVDCGESDIRCLEFDHRDPSTKSANVAKLLQRAGAWSTILAEIEKCDVRCANCHRRRTSRQFSTWRHRVNDVQTADLRAVALRRLNSILASGRPSAGE
jgi:hypothetical protein